MADPIALQAEALKVAETEVSAETLAGFQQRLGDIMIRYNEFLRESELIAFESADEQVRLSRVNRVDSLLPQTAR
jgi:hypothetical protein